MNDNIENQPSDGEGDASAPQNNGPVESNSMGENITQTSNSINDKSNQAKVLLDAACVDYVVMAEYPEGSGMYQGAEQALKTSLEEWNTLNQSIYAADSSLLGFLQADLGVSWYVSASGVVGATAGAAILGGAIGYTAGHYISWDGESLHEHIGDGLYSLCPKCWN